MQSLNVSTASISEVKMSPVKIFKIAESTENGVYIFNRGTVAGVMLTREQYERLTDGIEALTDRLIELEAAKRILSTELKTYTDEKVRNVKSDDVFPIDLDDGWN
jgi:PHD/YefM family antitoxin component YafN of YafNO toxin-antitoxin module